MCQYIDPRPSYPKNVPDLPVNDLWSNTDSKISSTFLDSVSTRGAYTAERLLKAAFTDSALLKLPLKW